MHCEWQQPGKSDARPSACRHAAAQFFTLREVAAGERLCISYIGDPAPIALAERHRRLRKAFFFDCNCER